MYFDELCMAMAMLAKEPHTIFMGQAVAYPGTAMYRTLEQVPRNQRLELPVAEDMQLGLAIGMSLNGDLPICCYPRFNFFLLAMSQLVLHLDKLPIYSDYRPKVIIRVAVGSDSPMDPGIQHLGDYADPIRQMLKTVHVVRVRNGRGFWPAYQAAVGRDLSTIIVEYSGRY